MFLRLVMSTSLIDMTSRRKFLLRSDFFIAVRAAEGGKNGRVENENSCWDDY